jgi:hypothetical protein
MKKALMGVIILIVALLVCFSTSATFVGEGLVGYLLIHLGVLASAAYLVPRCFASGRSNIAFGVEVAVAAVFIVGCIGFLITAGIANVMTQRIFAWLLLSGLAVLGIAWHYKYGKH